MIRSMTAFASARGEQSPYSWSWEMRGVNAKGLDLRLRVPDWLEGLEAALRAELTKSLARGSVTLGLRVNREDDAGQVTLNRAALGATLDAMVEVEAEARKRGLTLHASRASDLLALRGVLEAGAEGQDLGPLTAQIKSEFAAVVSAFVQMREAEGAALADVLQGQLDEVEALTAKAADLAEARKAELADTLRANLAKVLANTDGADPDRVAQELALIAVKADVTEEIDRLRTHVKAARGLLDTGGIVGRKLDFLMQEFNREANTLCSKSQNSELTAVGLDLKAVIDQMREQVQNVE